MSDSTTKRCSKCDTEYPATIEYFIVDKRKSLGVGAVCRDCKNKGSRTHYAENIERQRERTSQYYAIHKAERSAYAHSHYLENREKILTRCEIYRRENREARKLYAIAYREKNRETISIKLRNRRLANPEVFRKSERAYHNRNRDRRLEYGRQHNAQHPGASTIRWHRRRARLMQVDGVHTPQEIKDLFLQQDSRCGYCGISILGGYHIDHMTPISRGGGNAIDNLCLTCPHCNLEKHNKTLNGWMAIRGW